MKKELTVVERSFSFGSNYGNYYLKDNEGNIYCWYTSSDKAYEQMENGTKLLCSFITTGEKWKHDKFGEVITIKNVRF